jgi:hypothetical protein
MAVFAPLQPDPVRSRRPPDRQRWPEPKVTAPVDRTDADAEVKSPTAEAEEADGDVLLLDDQDGKLDANEIIGADIEKDDT